MFVFFQERTFWMIEKIAQVYIFVNKFNDVHFDLFFSSLFCFFKKKKPLCHYLLFYVVYWRQKKNAMLLLNERNENIN